MNLDFGVLPEECAKEMNLKFCNPGSASIPLKLITVHQVIVIVLPSYNMFFFSPHPPVLA
jgi:hypothetical protein